MSSLSMGVTPRYRSSGRIYRSGFGSKIAPVQKPVLPSLRTSKYSLAILPTARHLTEQAASCLCQGSPTNDMRQALVSLVIASISAIPNVPRATPPRRVDKAVVVRVTTESRDIMFDMLLREAARSRMSCREHAVDVKLVRYDEGRRIASPVKWRAMQSSADRRRLRESWKTKADLSTR